MSILALGVSRPQVLYPPLCNSLWLPFLLPPHKSRGRHSPYLIHGPHPLHLSSLPCCKKVARKAMASLCSAARPVPRAPASLLCCWFPVMWIFWDLQPQYILTMTYTPSPRLHFHQWPQPPTVASFTLLLGPPSSKLPHPILLFLPLMGPPFFPFLIFSFF